MKNYVASLTTLAFILLLIPACTKDDNKQIVVPPVSNTSQLIADRWSKTLEGNYENNFGNFYSAGKYAGIDPDKVKVYLVFADASHLISNTNMIYMSGIITAEKLESDLRIYYRPFNTKIEIPFKSITLKVSVE